MNIEEYKAVDEAIDKAEEDTTPFLVVNGDELNVVGDANKTKVNTHDYKILFRVVKDGKYEWSEQEFKNVYITPRNDIRVSRMLTQMMPYFRKEDGTKFTQEEAKQILENDSLLDIIYDTVAAVLGIPEKLADYMEPASVLRACVQIMKDMPNAVNEANTSFR